MFDPSTLVQQQPDSRVAREWVKILSKYREPNPLRSSFELFVTVGPFVVLWVLAWWSLSVSYWLTLSLSICNAGFLLFNMIAAMVPSLTVVPPATGLGACWVC